MILLPLREFSVLFVVVCLQNWESKILFTHSHNIVDSCWLEAGECVVPGAGEACDEGDGDRHLAPVARPPGHTSLAHILNLIQGHWLQIFQNLCLMELCYCE